MVRWYFDDIYLFIDRLRSPCGGMMYGVLIQTNESWKLFFVFLLITFFRHQFSNYKLMRKNTRQQNKILFCLEPHKIVGRPCTKHSCGYCCPIFDLFFIVHFDLKPWRLFNDDCVIFGIQGTPSFFLNLFND